jgi:hypothetical protein
VPTGRRRLLYALLALACAAALLLIVGKVWVDRRFGSSVFATTTQSRAPAALEGVDVPDALPERVPGVVDSHLLAAHGELIVSQELAHRRWQIAALDFRTGSERWHYGRDNVNHIEAWTVAGDVVVVSFHLNSSRLGWRLGRWARLVGFDPVSGEILWQRDDRWLPPNGRPGRYYPDLAQEGEVTASRHNGQRVQLDARTGADL